MEATTFYTNECSEAMFIQDNGQNGWIQYQSGCPIQQQMIPWR